MDILVFLQDGDEPVTVIPSKVINENVSKWNGIIICGWNSARTRVDVTLDHDNIADVDSLIRTGKFRSRSHALDEAVKLLLRKEAVKL